LASILAVMKLAKKKKRHCYIKMFKAFEAELKNYNIFFSGENYVIEYLICRDLFKGEDEISITFKFYPNPTVFVPTLGNYNLEINTLFVPLNTKREI
jgi:hypothetical protein